MARTIKAPAGTAVGGKVVSIDIDDELQGKIQQSEGGVTSISKIIEDKVVTVYVDRNFKVRGGEVSELAGTSTPASFGAFCTVVEERIKRKDCDEVNMAMLRTYCKQSGYPACYKLRRKEMVKLIC